MDVGVLSGLNYAGFETDEILRRLREFAFAFHREHAAREGKTRWAEKTAVDAFHLDEISRLCGEHAYFVCITRHGLDVACSMSDWCEKSQVYLADIHRYIQRYPRPLEAFCHAWVDATAAIYKFRSEHPDNSILIRYEDLVVDPDREMQRITEFLGEPWNPELISQAFSRKEAKGFSDWKTYSRSAVESSGIGRWRTLPSGTVADLAPIVNPTLIDSGYEAVEFATGNLDGEAQRRYELGLLLQSLKSGGTDA
jgi:hypothetical protein